MVDNKTDPEVREVEEKINQLRYQIAGIKLNLQDQLRQVKRDYYLKYLKYVDIEISPTDWKPLYKLLKDGGRTFSPLTLVGVTIRGEKLPKTLIYFIRGTYYYSLPKTNTITIADLPQPLKEMLKELDIGKNDLIKIFKF